MDCPKCGVKCSIIEHILDRLNLIWIKITPFYRCDICDIEFYNLDELK